MKIQHILNRNFSSIILMLAFIQLSPFLLKAKSFEKYHSFHQASILADADNGRILRNYRSQKTIYPASLVKMMVALITLEEINKGNIHLSDSIKVSSWASRIGGRQVYLKQGEEIGRAHV